MPKSYLGDGVYVDFEGVALTFTTEEVGYVYDSENGRMAVRIPSNRIALKPAVLESLLRYLADRKADAAEKNKEDSTKDEPRCPVCGTRPASLEHTCPYDAEMSEMSDGESVRQCTCCETCTQECCDDI